MIGIGTWSHPYCRTFTLPCPNHAEPSARYRSVTFLKRKGGLFKKAHELSVLCSVDVAVIIFGHNKKLYEYSSSDINEIIGRFQYYGGAHEHKGPADFADKGAGGDEDDDDEDGAGGDLPASQRNTPAPPEHPMMHPHMQHHPGFQHVRHGTPSGSPPMHNGNMPQFVRGPSPLPPGISRPTSRTQEHPAHLRRVSSNLVPPHMQQTQGPQPQPHYAYTPNSPFYNPQAAAQMQQRPVQGQPGYPPGYAGPPPPQHQQIQQAYMQDARRQSGPPAYPQQQPPQAVMSRHPSSDHLQPPQAHPHPSPRPRQGPQRGTPSPQPLPQHQFTSPPIPQPRPLPAAAQASIFTPIDDTRSMLARNWVQTSNHSIDSRIDPAIKMEEGVAPRSASVDVGAMQRSKANAGTKSNGASPQPPPPRLTKSPQPSQRTASVSSMPAGPRRTNTSQSDAKRPRLKVQIPSEQSGDEGGTGSAPDDTATATQQAVTQPGRALPPPSPSAGALLSAGAQGPSNPFARPPPPVPMSTNPHAVRTAPGEGNQNHIETPISALPSRFMSNELLPSPSSFYPDWNLSAGLGGGSGGGLLPSPLNFTTPTAAGGGGWLGPGREEEKKRPAEESTGGEQGDAKRAKV